ncbi:aminoglycoside phosphotransferase family protein [Mesorhizobium sp. A623]
MMKPPVFPRRWKIGGAVLIAETFSSRIWKVARADGSLAVVKALKPFDDVEDELRGAHFLKWRGGAGAVRLLRRDRRQMLLEYGGYRLLTSVLDIEGDEAATEIAADVLARLHRPSDRPAPPQLQPLRERFAGLFSRAGTASAPAQSLLYMQGATVADALLDDARDVRPLHGDLHHDNIVHGQRGWLAIDPKGVLGDPGFDAANFFYNPLDRDALCLDPERIVRLAQTFSATLGQDPRRVLDHAFAYGCLSAAWHGEGGNATDESRELAVTAAVRSVRLNF